MSLPLRKIGTTPVTAIGYGAMGISAFYGKALPDEERLKILDAVYENGCTMWDTANIYDDSEVLIGKWFKRTGKRNEIFLATKFGIFNSGGRAINGDPEYVHQAFEISLKRLGVDKVELYYLHRPDSTVPIERTVGAMAELVKAGKVKYLGLSECSAETLRRAHAVHPISALQVEYSPFTLDIEDEKIGLLKTARELGVTIIAYSPLGRGLITGKYRSPDDFDEDDFRLTVPRYSKENFPNILKLADGLKRIGDRHGATAGQVSLAWLLAQGPDVIPIPGTTKIPSLKENLGAAKLTLTPEEIQEVREIAKAADASNGPRYPGGMESLLFADTPPL
ncbi:Aldo-keto reductase yakc [NADP(+)] [Sparassis crispa]|uniref:Aldo-keto reductase yakc [NADP(+)] n=1 Tax=Sparassis crispa TaxID=139825 RepID=A0A401H3Y5_9APHY|nr:Aldo-keto reductase yakc [NADP(+)] [Sparassis crispa]GBE89156.1 Aldo-keto reductase yakc [NADP(+)] [Sparassis crispa]